MSKHIAVFAKSATNAELATVINTTAVLEDSLNGPLDGMRTWRVISARELARRDHERIHELMLAGKWDEIFAWRKM